MLKRFVSYILIAVMSLALFSGCSSADNDQDKPFSAQEFVDDCRILLPAARYQKMTQNEFAAKYVITVLDQFAKSDYYTNMSNDERENAFNEIGNVLSSYSYGQVSGGFVSDFEVNMKKHEITWFDKSNTEIEMLWTIPG